MRKAFLDLHKFPLTLGKPATRPVLGVLLALVFFESAGDELKIRKRFALTREVAKKRGVEAVSYMLQEKTPLGQSFELLVLGSYVSFYLAMLYGLDPTPIPMVDWFKKNMYYKRSL